MYIITKNFRNISIINRDCVEAKYIVTNKKKTLLILTVANNKCFRFNEEITYDFKFMLN